MLDNISIRYKLIIGCGILILCTIAVSGFLLHGMDSTYVSAQRAIAQQGKQLSMENVRFLTTQGHLWFEEIMGGDTTESTSECYALWETARGYCRTLVAGGPYQQSVLEPVQDAAIRSEIEHAESLLIRLLEIARERETDFKTGSQEGAAGSSADQQFDEVYTGVMESMEKAHTLQAGQVQRELEGIAAGYNQRWIVAVCLIAAALILGAGFTLLTGKRIVRPIRELDDAAHSIADGDWNRTLAVASNDELGALARSFNTMAEQLRLSDERAKRYLAEQVAELLRVTEQFAGGDLTARTVITGNDEIARLGAGFNAAIQQVGSVFRHVAEASETTTHTTVQISNIIRQVADTSAELLARITDISASVEEMAYTITENAHNAEQTATTAENSGQLAGRGGAQVQQTLEQMHVITEVIQQSAATVERLGTSSMQIGEIIVVINDIADQTNLLALNAAIEAARAGEHGRGFAVVADEVRKLAERTSKATGEIGRMIKQIQRETQDAVVVMRKGEQEVRQGMDVAGRAGSELQEIIEGSIQVKHMVGRIAAASVEQSQAANTMAAGIEAITSQTRQTTSTIQQIVPMIDELNEVTSVLQQYVEQFSFADE